MRDLSGILSSKCLAIGVSWLDIMEERDQSFLAYAKSLPFFGCLVNHWQDIIDKCCSLFPVGSVTTFGFRDCVRQLAGGALDVSA